MSRRTQGSRCRSAQHGQELSEQHPANCEHSLCCLQEELDHLQQLLARAAGWQLGLHELQQGFEEGDEDAPVVVDL